MKKWFRSTVFRYFLSYFVIFCISVVGMFVLFRSRLIDSLTKQYETQIVTELAAGVSRLKDEINTLITINDQIVDNADIMLAKYSDHPSRSHQLQRELKKYAIGKPIIRAIGYIDKKRETLYSYSAGDYISYKDGVVTLITLDGSLSFRPDDYKQIPSGQLIYLSAAETSRFVYLPLCPAFYNYSTFYVLDNPSLEEACKTLISDMVVASALIAPDGSVPASAQKKGAAVDWTNDSASGLYLSEAFFGGYRLAALYSDDTLSARISQAIRVGMPWFVLISVAGFALVIVFTISTYNPLRRLAHKIDENGADDLNLLRHLDRAIERQQTQNDNLRNRIEHYRTIMQKMLLDSMLVSEGAQENAAQDLDSYFLLPEQHFIAAFAVGATNVPETLFEAADHALFLKQESNVSVYLINRFFESDVSHETTLLSLAESIHQKTGAFVGVSDTTSSAMDIPSLVEQARNACAGAADDQACVLWQQTEMNAAESAADYEYPHEHLALFAKHVSSGDFPAAHQSLSDLLSLLSFVRAPGDALPDFFVRSVLIDLLSDLAIQMDNTKIRFKEYEDLYFKALYLCRSCSFQENRDEIHALFTQMLNVYEAQSVSDFPNAEKIRQIVEENYSNPDFSISLLYAGHEISLAYMSHLFKKETGENFSDYLWNVRYKKALELLENGNMNINDISLAVGYLHPSSFRRKFKQETGISPSDYQITKN